MGLETVTYISDFNQANPGGATDLKSEGDNHIRNIKKGILNTFPNITGEVTPTQDELNLLASRTLASTGTAIDNFPAGTIMAFQQTAAPTGWTKQVTHNDKALRVVSGTAGDGGTTAFTTALVNSIAESGAVGDHQLTIAEMPAHTHTQNGSNTGVGGNFSKRDATNQASSCGETASEGGDGTHSHTLQLNVQYVDLILASKD